MVTRGIQVIAALAVSQDIQVIPVQQVQVVRQGTVATLAIPV